MKDLVLERISPVFIGFHDTAHTPHFYSNETYGKRRVCHYELEYIVSSQNGYIITDQIPFSVSFGDVLFRYPGMEVEGIGIYHSIFVEFDLNPLAEESDTLRKIPPIFHNSKGLCVNEEWFSRFHLLNKEDDCMGLWWKAEILQVLFILLKEAEKSGERKEWEMVQLQKMREALAFIQEHYAEDITIKQLAEQCGYSKFHFCRVFKSITHLTPIQYVVQYRIQKAREYLFLTDEKIEVIMERVGFHNYGYFWRTFKKLYGVSPREFRCQKLSL